MWIVTFSDIILVMVRLRVLVEREWAKVSEGEYKLRVLMVYYVGMVIMRVLVRMGRCRMVRLRWTFSAMKVELWLTE